VEQACSARCGTGAFAEQCVALLVIMPTRRLGIRNETKGVGIVMQTKMGNGKCILCSAPSATPEVSFCEDCLRGRVLPALQKDLVTFASDLPQAEDLDTVLSMCGDIEKIVSSISRYKTALAPVLGRN
jgi:hypothetical protein